MNIIKIILLWAFAVIHLVFAALAFRADNMLAFLILFVMFISIIPVTRKFFKTFLPEHRSPITQIGIYLSFMLVLLIILNMQSLLRTSIYKSSQARIDIMNLYDDKMEQWYDNYSSIYLQTDFGEVHLIESGDPQNPVAILFPPADLAAWSWAFNIEKLNSQYHTFALDIIGAAGRSTLRNLKKIPVNSEQITDIVSDGMIQFGVKDAVFIGCSIGANYVLRIAETKPEIINKMILISPLGLSPENSAISSTLFLNIYQCDSFVQNIISLFYSNSPTTESFCQDWLELTIRNVDKAMLPVKRFSAYELHNMNIPTLVIMGRYDKTIPDTNEVIENSAVLPDVRIEIVDAEHFPHIQNSGKVNSLIHTFLDEPED